MDTYGPVFAKFSIKAQAGVQGKYYWTEFLGGIPGQVFGALDFAIEEDGLLGCGIEVDIRRHTEYEMDAIFLAPTPIDKTNINVVIEAGHIAKAKVCEGAMAGVNGC